MDIAEILALLANFAEIVGVLLLVVSLIYVGVQIKQNTAATKARAGFDATHSWADVNLAVSQNPELVELIGRVSDPKASLSDLAQDEALRMTFAFRGLIQKLEGQYHLYKEGYLDTDLWMIRCKILRGILQLPVLKEWWPSEKLNYSSEFIGEIEKGADAYDPFEPLRPVGKPAGDKTRNR